MRRWYGEPVAEVELRTPRAVLVATPAGALHTLEWGDPSLPPLVLVHGLNANARYWTGVASLLADRFRVLAPDLRGHGATGFLGSSYGLTTTREDLVAWADEVGLERFGLVGHSWGGKVSLDLAAAVPERIRRLALVDPVPPQGLHSLIQKNRRLINAIFAPERGPFADGRDYARARRTVSWLHHEGTWMRDAFDHNFHFEADGSIHPILNEAGFRAIYDGVLCHPSPLPLTAVTLPVLLLRATASVMLFPGEVHPLTRAMPQLESRRIPGEHSLHATNPRRLAWELDRFMTS
jgi:pimeloyl-ACP methyl ester carboxylesterase